MFRRPAARAQSHRDLSPLLISRLGSCQRIISKANFAWLTLRGSTVTVESSAEEEEEPKQPNLLCLTPRCLALFFFSTLPCSNEVGCQPCLCVYLLLFVLDGFWVFVITNPSRSAHFPYVFCACLRTHTRTHVPRSLSFSCVFCSDTRARYSLRLLLLLSSSSSVPLFILCSHFRR